LTGVGGLAHVPFSFWAADGSVDSALTWRCGKKDLKTP
jgi:hypothetical protein